MPGSGTKLTCHCGNVAITFANPRPNKCVECCCCDCRHTREYCHRQQCREKEEEITPIKLHYLDNDILQVETTNDDDDGKPFYLLKLRPSSGSLRLFTKCCHSAIMALHPLYLRQRLCLMPAAAGKLEYAGDPIEPYARMQTKFWPSEKELPQLQGEDMLETASDDPTWVFSIGLMQYMMWPRPTTEGFTARKLIQDYCDDKEEVKVLDIPEDELEGHFQTGGGIFSLTLKNPFSSSKSRQDDQHTG